MNYRPYACIGERLAPPSVALTRARQGRSNGAAGPVFGEEIDMYRNPTKLLAAALVAASVLIVLAAPATRAEDYRCVIFNLTTACFPPFTQAFNLSILGIMPRGIVVPASAAFDADPISGAARIFGDTFDTSTMVGFSFDIRFHRSDEIECPIFDSPTPCEDPATYQCYFPWSGKLVGHGPDFEGAVYSLTGSDSLIFGDGAFIWHPAHGFRGDLSLVLVEPGDFPGLPEATVGSIRAPFDDVSPGSFQGPLFSDNFCTSLSTNDLAGTWTGPLDCSGSSGQVEVSPSDTTKPPGELPCLALRVYLGARATAGSGFWRRGSIRGG